MNKIVPKWHGRVNKGKLHFEGAVKNTFDSYLLNLKDGFVEVTVRPYSQKSERSNQQNRYMWGVVYKLISEHTGYSEEAIHEAFKHMFLKEWLLIADRDILSTKSTTSLNTVEMEEYLEQIKRWSSLNLGLCIPDPNEVEIDGT